MKINKLNYRKILVCFLAKNIAGCARVRERERERKSSKEKIDDTRESINKELGKNIPFSFKKEKKLLRYFCLEAKKR